MHGCMDVCRYAWMYVLGKETTAVLVNWSPAGSTGTSGYEGLRIYGDHTLELKGMPLGACAQLQGVGM